MIWQELLAASVALFSVFGVYCAWRTLAELLGASQRVLVAVEVLNRQDADALELLLQEASDTFLRRGHLRIVVLVSVELMDGTVGLGDELSEPYLALLERYGADCYLIEP